MANVRCRAGHRSACWSRRAGRPSAPVVGALCRWGPKP
jgi:hypothetical protein